jgi:Lysozyme like domain
VTHYTYAQLEGLWIGAGGPKAQAPLAAAIAEAESGGNSQATNPTDNNGTQTSWGLWQISNGTHGQPVPNILSPAINAQQAVAKYRGAGNKFTPWGTYDSGAYRAFLSGSTTPDTSVPSLGAPAPPGTSAQDAGGPPNCLFMFPNLDSLSSVPLVGGLAPNTSFCIVSRTEARAVLGTLLLVSGAAILGLGVIILAAYGLKSTGAGKVAGKVMEAGGAVLAVGGAPEAGAPIAAAGAATSRASSKAPARPRRAAVSPARTKASQTTAS